MIDKLTPRFLDKSTDEKLVQKTSFIDALNVYVDGDGFSGEDAGVIKAIKGMKDIISLTAAGVANQDWFCLGHVTDQNTGIVYFFLVFDNEKLQWVWAYNHRGVLPYVCNGAINPATTSNVIYKVATSHLFNFPSRGHVAANIVYSNTNEFLNPVYAEAAGDGWDPSNYPEKDVLLYFTDNKNEPRMINAYRAYLSEGLPMPNEPVAENRQVNNDFICACPRVPLDPIKFVWESDESLSVNNFATTPGFQFAYQNIYKDGAESAISPYSDIAFPPSIVNRGATETDNLLAHNKCVLTIPGQTREVERIRVLARYGNGANFVEIEEIDNPGFIDPYPIQDIEYVFLNDRVAAGVSKATVDKTFDNVPRKAEAQAVVSERIMYGNYVEGFDNVDCSGVTLEPLYNKRPAELINYEFKIEPTIEYSNDDNNQNKTIGFRITSDDFADEIEAGTRIAVSFSFTPDKNFHVYNFSGGDSSYHQSRQVGTRSLNLPGYNETGIVAQSPAADQEVAYQRQFEAGSTFLQNEQESFFGNNDGVMGSSWRVRIGTEHGFGPNVQGNVECGTSAGNPLIVKGGTIDFKVEFIVNNEIETNGGGFINSVVVGVLSGMNNDQIAAEYGIPAESFEVVTAKTTHEHNVDLGLSDYNSFSVSSDLGSLICGGAFQSAIGNNVGQPPGFAFILNKVRVPFFLERSPQEGGGTYEQRFNICIENVYAENNDDSVMTCVRWLDPYSPWWAITPETIQSPDFLANFINIFENNLTPQSKVFQPMGANFDGAPATGLLRNMSTKLFGSFSNETNAPQPYPIGAEENLLPGAVMSNCMGYMIIPQIQEEYPLLSAQAGAGEPWSFSLMDGEGGPGGKGSPGSPYDIFGLEQYGSLAGQAFIEYDDSSIDKAKNRGYVGYTFSGNPDAPEPPDELSAMRYVGDASLAGEIDLSFNFDAAGFNHTSVFMGPFYTGRIVMNNINSNEPDLGYVNPSGTSMNGADREFAPLTTLPLVWFSSGTKFEVTEGGSNAEAYIQLDDQSAALLNNAPDQGEHHQVSYPYPIVVPIGEGGSGGYVDGVLTSGELVQDPFNANWNCVDFERLHSYCEASRFSNLFEPTTFFGGNSFKAGASHEFGVVYYDERGRHGYVNPIGSTYVKTMGERVGNEDDKGAAFIRVSNITHDPPPWAKHYKIVYSKNTSIDSFVQYTSGGAYVANAEYEGGTPSEIYVSLNYFQGHPISYSNSFGAKGEDGTPVLYSFTPGDRLRVVSWMNSLVGESISRVYPTNIEFEVTGLTQFDDTNNPFVVTNDETGAESIPEKFKGLFLVLKNNVDAYGFRHADVEVGNDNWGSNCVFEIYSPVKELDADKRLYYEIGDTYPVVYAGIDETGDGEPDYYTYKHLFEDIVLTQGDVFFRRHAVNLREFDAADGFVDLLAPTENEEETYAAEANFKSYYLESEAATDLFPSRAISIGRPNIVKLDSRETRKQASVIHSDKDIIESSKVGYSSFNRSIPSDLDIDFKEGAIHYLANFQDSLMFIQTNKSGRIPVDRTLIADVQGSQSLVASSKVLGTPSYYALDSGCDGDPSSVVKMDSSVFFVNKSRGKVYKVHPSNGVNVISDAAMAGFFRDALRLGNLTNKRIIGGYDPIKKEYLMSIVDQSTVPSSIVEEVKYPGVFTPLTDEVGDPVAPDVEVCEPVVRFDWEVNSNLSPSYWRVIYSGGGSGLANGDMIGSGLSWFKTSENGNTFPIIGNNATVNKINITVENYQCLEEDKTFVISLPGVINDDGSPAFNNPGYSSFYDWELGPLDEIDVANVRPFLESEGLDNVENVGPAWHLNPMISTSVNSDYPAWLESEHGDINSLSEIPEVFKKITVKAGVPGYSGTVSYNIGVKFLCDGNYEAVEGEPQVPGIEDGNSYELRNPFYLPNTQPVSATVEGSIRIEGVDGATFSVGGGTNEVGVTFRKLYGDVVFQAFEPSSELEEG